MTTVSLILLVVSAGLVLVAMSYWAGAHGREPDPWLRLAMAGMSGLALGFLAHFLFIVPYVMFPLGFTAILVAHWLSSRRLGELGTFLLAAAAYWMVAELSARLNDLSDPAVSYPGWTPVPVAVAAALVVFGASLIVGERLANRA